MKFFEEFYKRIHGDHPPISFVDLFTDDFMSTCTTFDTFPEMIHQARIEKIDDFFTPRWDHFVKTNTMFENWEEMYRAANDGWQRRRRAEAAGWN